MKSNISDFEKQSIIQSKLTRQLFSAGRASLVTGMLLACVLTYILVDVISATIIYSWLTLIIFLAFARAVFIATYLRSHLNNINASHNWLKKYRLLIFLMGAIWGSTGIILFPDGYPQHQLFLIFMLAGLTAGGVVAFSADLICAITFTMFDYSADDSTIICCRRQHLYFDGRRYNAVPWVYDHEHMAY